MANLELEPRSVLAWLDILDHIDRSLLESLALAPELPDVAVSEGGSGAAALKLLDERLARWQACLEDTARKAVEAEALVTSAEDALSALRGRIGPARERLVTGAKRPV
jgi:hypothetical protein